MNNYSNDVPGNVPYSNIVWKGIKYYDLTRQYYWRNTQESAQLCAAKTRS